MMILGLKATLSNWWDRQIVKLFVGFIGTVANVFKFSEWFYSVFATLAGASDIFDESLYGNITLNLYAVLGVVVLFVMAYNFLMIIIDPDKSSGEFSVKKFLMNLATTLILITLLAPIFHLANGIVGSIIDGNVIGKIIFSGAASTVEEYCVINGQLASSYTTQAACENANGDWTNEVVDTTGASGKNPINGIMISVFSNLFEIYNASASESINEANFANVWLCRPKDKYPSDKVKCYNNKSSCTLNDIIVYSQKIGSYDPLKAFASNWYHKNNSDCDGSGLTFHYFTGLIVGGYMIYILVLFCFDLAVRVIKIGFYQIVAPICVACRIMPGKEDIYKKWRSLTIKTYLLVLVRVFALFLGIKILSLLTTLMGRVTFPGYCDGFCRLVVKFFLILGILTFIKEIPKVIEEVFGIESGLTSTVKDKLKAASEGAKAPIGALAAGAAGAKGFKRGVNNFKDKLAEIKKNRQEMKKNLEDSLDTTKTAAERKAAQEAYLKNRKNRGKLAANSVAAFAGIAAGAGSAMARSVAKSTGMSDTLSDIGKQFKGIKENSEEAAQASQDARERRKNRLERAGKAAHNFKEFMKNGGRRKRKELEKKKAEIEAKVKATCALELENINKAKDELNKQKERVQNMKDAIARGHSLAEKMQALQKERKELSNLAANATDPEAKALYAHRAAELQKELKETEAQYMANEPDMINAQNKLAAEQVKLDGLDKAVADAQAVYDKALQLAAKDYTVQVDGVNMNLESINAELTSIKGLEKAFTDVSFFEELKKNFSNSMNGDPVKIIQRNEAYLKVLNEVDGSMVNDGSAVLGKFDGPADISCSEKFFSNEPDARKVLDILGEKNPNHKGLMDKLSDLGRAMDDTQFQKTLLSAGLTPADLAGIDITSLRGTMQSRMPDLKTKITKDSVYRLADEIRTYAETGVASGGFAQLQAQHGDTPEVVALVSSVANHDAAYETFGDNVGGTTKDHTAFKDSMSMTTDRMKAESSPARYRKEIRNIQEGKNDKK